MISLILCLPIYASEAYAGFSNVKAQSDNSNKDNMYGVGDKLTISADVKIDGDSEITTNQVLYWGNRDEWNDERSKGDQIQDLGDRSWVPDPANEPRAENKDKSPQRHEETVPT